MARSIWNARQRKLIIEGLEKQGVKTRFTDGAWVEVKFPNGDMTYLDLGSQDTHVPDNVKTQVRRAGLLWPLDAAYTKWARDTKPKVVIVETAPAPRLSPAQTAVVETMDIAFAVASAEAAPPSVPERKLPTVSSEKPTVAPRITGVSQSIEVVTPALAETWLATMGRNRHLSTTRVEAYTKFMKDGLWIYDGDPIRFNQDGELVDGQHRLWALVEANYTTQFLVVRGVSREAFATMNTGKTRSFSDIMSVEYPEIPSIVRTGTVVQVIYRWSIGRRGSTLSSSGANQAIPNAVLLAFFEANKDTIVRVVREGGRVIGHVHGMTITTAAIGLWAFEKIDSEDATDFFDKLMTGRGLESGSPILAYRNWIARNMQGASTNARVPLDMGVALLIKAWNAYRDGTEVTNLRWRRGGANPEAFPEPK